MERQCCVKRNSTLHSMGNLAPISAVVYTQRFAPVKVRIVIDYSNSALNFNADLNLLNFAGQKS